MEIGAAKCSCAICFVDSMETTPIRTGKIRAINTSTKYLGKVHSWWKYDLFMGERSGACELPRVEARTLASPAGVPFDCDLRNRVADQSRVPRAFFHEETRNSCHRAISEPRLHRRLRNYNEIHRGGLIVALIDGSLIWHPGDETISSERRGVSRDVVTFRIVLSSRRGYFRE